MSDTELYNEANALLRITKEKIRNYDLVRGEINKNYALDFNPLNTFFPISENKLSSIIAFFLDPEAAHYQGDVYAKAMLSYILKDDFDEDCSILSSHREYLIDNRRRIDILLKYRKKDGNENAIAFEIKIWAADQPQQLTDYHNYLASHYATENFHLVYWNPYSDNPDETSVAKIQFKTWTNFKILDHSTHSIELLEQWLRLTKPASLRMFIENVINYLQVEINGKKYLDMTENIENLINGENLQAARLLKDALQNRLQTVAQNFVDGVVKGLNELSKVKNQTIEIKEKKLDGSNIQYEFINKDLEIVSYLKTEYPQGLWIGIVNSSGNLKINALEYHQLLLNENNGKGGFDKYWYWQFLGNEDTEVSAWFLNEKGFNMMQEDDFKKETAKKIFDLMQLAKKIADENSQ